MSCSQALERYGLPEWIKPFKNEWRTISGLRRLIAVNNCKGLFTALISNKCRSVTVDYHGKQSRKYLVKHAYVLARAHGIQMELASGVSVLHDLEVALSRATQTSQRLEKECESLKADLLREKANAEANMKSLLESFSSQKELLSNPARTLASQLVNATEALPKSGVYFLLNRGQIVYVGQSQNVLSRMSGHREKMFDTVRMLAVPPEKLNEVELKFIHALNPPLNSVGTPKGCQ